MPKDVETPAAKSARSPVGYFLVLLVVNFMWAFQFSGAKIATEQLGPVTVTLLPLALSTLLFAPFALRKRGTAGKVGARAARGYIIAGVLGVFGAQLGLTAGVERSLASNASVLTLTIPILTAIIAGFLLGERMSLLRWVSFVLAIGGVLMVSDIDWRSVRIFQGKYLAGNLLILWSCLGSAFYNTYSKRLLETHGPIEVLFYSFLAADAVLLVLMAVLEPFSFQRIAGLGASVWLSLAAIALLSLSASMVLFFWVIQKIDVTQASLSIYLMPVFGVWIAMVTLREKVTFQLIAGGVLVLVSTFLVTTYEEWKKRRDRS